MGFKLEGAPGTKNVNLVGKPAKGKKEGHTRLIPPATLFCLHCGEKYEVNVPVSMGVFVGAMRGFDKDHKGCKRSKQRGIACTFCFRFGHPLLKCPTLEYEGDPMRWRHGPDTGMSSICIFERLHNGFVSAPAHVPLDPSDFGRCHRLLQAISGWREQLHKMGDVPGWQKFVVAWDELEKLYEEELPSGLCPKLYDRMQKILGGV